MLNYLKRRFSSGDLQGEGADSRAQQEQELQQQQQQEQQKEQKEQQEQKKAEARESQAATPVQPRKSVYPSAPTSPSKTAQPAPTSASSFAGQIGSSIIGRSLLFHGRSASRDRCKVLLVVDEPHTDWSKYFRSRKIQSDWDVRVEQAAFSDIRLTASSAGGCQISVGSGKSARLFKPDCALIRQRVRDARSDWRGLLAGLTYAGVPCVNQAATLYNFADRAWLFANLTRLQARTGAEAFPLIDQTIYLGHLDLQAAAPSAASAVAGADGTGGGFPIALKIGHAHNGIGKLRAADPEALQEAGSLLALLPAGDAYATAESLLEARCDILLQKIGANYKAFLRRSISGSWKVNSGSAMLEQLPVTEEYRRWLDELSGLFSGADICALEAVQLRSGAVRIIGASGSDMPLLGDSQEEDRRHIADVVLARMMQHQQQLQQEKEMEKDRAAASATAAAANGPPAPAEPEALTTAPTTAAPTATSTSPGPPPQRPPPPPRQMSATASPSSGGSGRSGGASRPGEDSEDTMKNLRKTFAGIGIFRDM